MNFGTRFRASTASVETQRERIQALVARFPERHIHVLDAMYRLTSPVLVDSSGVRVWEEEGGHLVGFAIWHPAFKVLDYGFDPHAGGRRLADDVLEWAVDWFTEQAQRSHVPLTCWIKVLAQNPEWREAVESRGFARCAWSIVHMERPLDREIETAPVPDGFRIRQIAGEAEADAWAHLHRAVFARAAMTSDWRLAMMRAPTYRADLDLIAVAPDGELAAFCQGWVGSILADLVGEIEPFGTHPAYRRQGLGRAVLLELMRRMRAQRVRAVFAEPWDDNLGALQSYQTVGFVPRFTISSFAREFRRG